MSINLVVHPLSGRWPLSCGASENTVAMSCWLCKLGARSSERGRLDALEHGGTACRSRCHHVRARAVCPRLSRLVHAGRCCSHYWASCVSGHRANKKILTVSCYRHFYVEPTPNSSACLRMTP